MKNNAFIKIALIVVASSLLLFVTYCGTDLGSDDESVPVSITFNIPSVKMKTGRVLNKSTPSIVKSIIITISAIDMTTISNTFNVSAGTTSVKVFVPPGTERTFTADAYDGASGSGFLFYRGTTIQDVVGVATTVRITMKGKFVDVNIGDDNLGNGSPINPYKTITFALSASAGNEPINVAAGSYNAVSGELFPLQLKAGTALNCYGTGHTTVIDMQNDLYEILLGASGATINGCKLTNSGSSAIVDNGSSITVNNNIITNNCNGLWISADSIITNNVIEITQSGECVSPSGIYSSAGAVPNSPTISGNTIKNNENGISIDTSNPVISGNIITNNLYNGIDIGGGGTPTINNNIISCNNLA